MTKIQNSRIRGIIFDLGGVIITENVTSDFYAYVAKTLNIPQKKLKNVMAEEVQLLSRGEEADIEFWKRVCKLLGVDCPANNVLSQLFTKTYGINVVVDRDMEKFIQKLFNKYKLGLLSNTIEVHANVFKKFDVLKYFNPVILSFEVGLIKPYREIYELAIEKMLLHANELLFIDDREENIKGAKEAGIKGILYKNFEQFKKELSKYMIL